MKSDREKNIKVALAINSLDAPAPSKYCIELLNEYVKGNMAAAEITQKLTDKYRSI